MGAFVIVGGFFIGIFGKPFFKFVICVGVTFGVTGILTLLLFTLFFNMYTPNWLGWLVLVLSGLVGCCLGVILAKLARLGVAVVAAFGGFSLGLIIYAAFLYKADNDKQVLYWCFNIGMALVFGLLSLWLFDHMIIVSTSIVGSYLFIRGISLYAGHFPGEVSLIDDIKRQGLNGIDPIFYAYMVSFIIATIICLVVQYKFWGKKDTHKHPYHYSR